jgi:hypothetical protein
VPKEIAVLDYKDISGWLNHPFLQANPLSKSKYQGESFIGEVVPLFPAGIRSPSTDMNDSGP